MFFFFQIHVRFINLPFMPVADDDGIVEGGFRTEALIPPFHQNQPCHGRRSRFRSLLGLSTRIGKLARQGLTVHLTPSASTPVLFHESPNCNGWLLGQPTPILFVARHETVC